MQRMNQESINILQVEDDANDVFLLREAFQQAQLPVTLRSVGDGQRAMDYLLGVDGYANRNEYPFPNLLLLDLKGQPTHGFEVLDWIRSQRMLKNLPVVVFSSSTLDRDLETAHRKGANVYVVKPIHFGGMVEAARKIYDCCLNAQAISH